VVKRDWVETALMLLGLLICFAVMAAMAKLENGFWWR
jgi:hypothetical protein